MTCLRCGYCCIKSAVIIVDNPELGPIEGNLIIKPDGPCQHLIGNEPGEYSCAVHDYPWYPETPCFAYGQIENKPSNCRMGDFIMSREVNK